MHAKMKRHKWIGIECLTVVFSMAAGLAWAAPQDQQMPSKDEFNAYQAVQTERDAQSQIKSLDGFVSKYPTSVLLPNVYHDYYLAYYQLKNYPQTIEYVDRLLALSDKIGPGTILQALSFRAKAYCVGSGNTGLQAPEADTKARDAAAQGLQMLARWVKPQNMTDEQFAVQRKNLGDFFRSVAEIADAHLKGNKSSVAPCQSDATEPADPGRFGRIMNQIGAEERQSPRVR
jgi:hypothetical protein